MAQKISKKRRKVTKKSINIPANVVPDQNESENWPNDHTDLAHAMDDTIAATHHDFDPADLSDCDDPIISNVNKKYNSGIRKRSDVPQSAQLQLLRGPVDGTTTFKFFPGFPDDSDSDDPDGTGPNKDPLDPSIITGFNSMGGCSHLLDEVRTRILFPIMNPDFMARHNRLPPKGIVLHGPPGTGKTLFAKCLAAELSRLKDERYTFLMRRGPDVLDSLVGESEKNLQRVFALAKLCKPCILFFDEVDALCPDRNQNESCLSTVNLVCTMLGEMDKIVDGEVLVLIATNRLGALDPAMIRPGRCDLALAFFPPNFEGRKEILEIYTKNWTTSTPSPTLINQLALNTNGFTGADMNKLCSEAFFNCVKRSQGPAKNSSKLTVKEVSGTERITERDWMEALGSMRPSKSNVFGSYVRTLEISEFAQPLIQNIANNLVNRLRPILPLGEGTDTSGMSQNGRSGGPSGFLVWNCSGKSDDIIDSLLVPMVLGHFGHLSIFVINEETMLQEHQYISLSAITDIIEQAKDCEKPSILFIPRIDTLVNRCTMNGSMLFGGLETDCAQIIRRLLFNVGNSKTPLNILATASCDVSGLSRDLQPIFDGFNRVSKVPGPDEKARMDFFEPIFHEHAMEFSKKPPAGGKSRKGGKKAGQGGGGGRNFKGSGDDSDDIFPDHLEETLDELLDEVVSLTGHSDMWSMITLHRELYNLCMEHVESQNKTGLLVKVNDVIEQYGKTELGAAARSKKKEK